MGPVQAILTPVTVPKGRMSETLVLEQVNGPVLSAVILGGGAVFEVTVTLALPVFPELVPVTV